MAHRLPATVCALVVLALAATAADAWSFRPSKPAKASQDRTDVLVGYSEAPSPGPTVLS